MKTITNNIKCLNLNFVNGIANTFINCPFLVNELHVVGLSLSQPLNSTNTNSQITYSTASFIGPVPPLTPTFLSTVTNAVSITVTGVFSASQVVVFAKNGVIAAGMTIVSPGVSVGTTIITQTAGTGGGIGTYSVSTPNI